MAGLATRTRVKVCGLTRPEDATLAAGLGVDAIGLVFYPPSPRAVTVEQARRVISGLPPFVTVTALFVNPRPDAVRTVLDALPIDLLQFHGLESAPECARYGVPYIKAIGMRDGVDLSASARRFEGARGLLLDHHDPEKWGGTGRRFDWGRVPAVRDKPIILAGGLTPDTVGTAIRRIAPFGVDVSGGVESAAGIKDAAKMAAFMREVRHAEAD